MVQAIWQIYDRFSIDVVWSNGDVAEASNLKLNKRYIQTDSSNCYNSEKQILTHLPLDIRATIFADNMFKCIFMNEKFCISIPISLKCVPEGLFDNKSATVQVMTWRLTGEKPLPEPMLTQFTDAYMQH